jgi:diguanylate cyclase (GGDEF)-like protein
VLKPIGSSRFGPAVSAVSIDIDQFERVNHTHGHQAGDRVLQTLADCCRSNVRLVDIVGGFGREEFLVVLPESDVEDAAQMAERLRCSIADAQTSWGQKQITVTASLGVATLIAGQDDWDTLIERADQAL